MNCSRSENAEVASAALTALAALGTLNQPDELQEICHNLKGTDLDELATQVLKDLRLNRNQKSK